MIKKNIKAVLFDFGGTLDHDGDSWGIRLYKQFNNAGLKINKNDYKDAAKRSMDQLFDNKVSATLAYKETVDIYIYWIIKNLKLIIKDYKKVLVKPFCLESLHYLERNKIILDKLSEKFTLGIISNNFGNCEGWCNEFEMTNFFKIIIDSNIVGYKKPDKRIFKFSCIKMGFPLDECIYIGDKYKTDIKPILELGMNPIWINNSDKRHDIDNKVIKIKTLLDLENIFDLKDQSKLLI